MVHIYIVIRDSTVATFETTPAHSPQSSIRSVLLAVLCVYTYGGHNGRRPNNNPLFSEPFQSPLTYVVIPLFLLLAYRLYMMIAYHLQR